MLSIVKDPHHISGRKFVFTLLFQEYLI